jgi:hypothetical protein
MEESITWPQCPGKDPPRLDQTTASQARPSLPHTNSPAAADSLGGRGRSGGQTAGRSTGTARRPGTHQPPPDTGTGPGRDAKIKLNTTNYYACDHKGFAMVTPKGSIPVF